jgi:hypothetical protein
MNSVIRPIVQTGAFHAKQHSWNLLGPALLRDNRQRTLRFRFRLAFGCPLSAFSRWE